MTVSRRLPEALAILVAFALGLMHGAPAWGQPAENQLPDEIITAGSLTGGQQETIDDYVTDRTTRLAEGEAPEVSRARRELFEPFQVPDASDAFIDYYSEAIASRLDDAFASDRALVRLNAMILVTRMPGDVADELIDAGLDDESSAVRYWAARAVREIADAGAFGGGQQEAMLDRLRGRLADEDATPVVEQLMMALIALPLDSASEPLVEALNGRVSRHGERPGRSVQPERSAMQELFRRLLAVDNPPSATMQELSRAAVRYMDVLAAALQAEDVEEHRQQQYVDTIELADHIVRTLHEEVGGAGGAPGDVSGAIRNGEWDNVRNAADRWREVLQQSPYNFDADDLAI